ncbi:MAG: hypothetical protein K2X27_24225, partial [Candidatus Obscuribacterales bacterium]|nr:hypothetical protein [Candidatus Obscuribacterales bacterium]
MDRIETSQLLKPHKSHQDFSPENCLKGIALSLFEGAVQNPYNGLTQIYNESMGQDNYNLPLMQISS